MKNPFKQKSSLAVKVAGFRRRLLLITISTCNSSEDKESMQFGGGIGIELMATRANFKRALVLIQRRTQREDVIPKNPS